MHRSRLARALMIAPIAMTAMAVIFLIVTLVAMSLWNWLTPDLFGWKPITFWQAAGLMILCRLLFGGFRGRYAGGGHWRHRMRERWERMSPGEREAFRAGMRARWAGFEPPPAEPAPSPGPATPATPAT